MLQKCECKKFYLSLDLWENTIITAISFCVHTSWHCQLIPEVRRKRSCWRSDFPETVIRKIMSLSFYKFASNFFYIGLHTRSDLSIIHIYHLQNPGFSHFMYCTQTRYPLSNTRRLSRYLFFHPLNLVLVWVSLTVIVAPLVSSFLLVG